MAFTFFSLLPEDPIEPLEETEAVLGSGVLFVPDREGGDSPLRAGGGKKMFRCKSGTFGAADCPSVYGVYAVYAVCVC